MTSYWRRYRSPTVEAEVKRRTDITFSRPTEAEGAERIPEFNALKLAAACSHPRPRIRIGDTEVDALEHAVEWLERLDDLATELVSELEADAASPRRVAELEAKMKRVRDGACALSGPGRGDCEHFVGLPGESIPGQHDGPDDTVDCYGRPNGWCQRCRDIRQLSNLQSRNSELESELELTNARLENAVKTVSTCRMIRRDGKEPPTGTEAKLVDAERRIEVLEADLARGRDIVRACTSGEGIVAVFAAKDWAYGKDDLSVEMIQSGSGADRTNDGNKKIATDGES